MLRAALELEPEHARALWSLGHAEILLAEDSRNRGDWEEGWRTFQRAEASLSKALELRPDDVWSLYARGASRAAFGEYDPALLDLYEAVEAADARLAEGPDEWMGILRFAALKWRAEVLMRSGRFEAARETLRAFHDEFSTNAWPWLVASAESELREHDLAAARKTYAAAREEFGTDSQPHEFLGSLAGLLGDSVAATEHLSEALRFERVPGMYTRLWLWILATDEARSEAEADLRDFLAHPPGSLGEWDRTLGLFAIGEGSEESFLEAARSEIELRMSSNRDLGDLMCEAWYYIGLRREAEPVEGKSAEEAYAACLAFDPVGWKWEWAFAQVRFAALTAGREPVPAHVPEDLTVLKKRWYAPGSERPVAELNRPLRPGDLMLVWYREADGEARFGRFLIGAR